MLVSCFLLMSTTVGNFSMITDFQITGSIIKEEGDYYVVDFSEDVAEKNLDDNFKQKKVNKKDCVRAKKYGD